MAITGTDKIFSVNDSEYGYTIKDEKPVASGGSIDIYVPKLMGDIDKVTPETINIDKLFDNASDCKPSFSTRVSRMKSFKPVLKSNCNWIEKINSKGVIPKGTMFTIEFLNGNIATPYLTTK